MSLSLLSLLVVQVVGDTKFWCSNVNTESEKYRSSRIIPFSAVAVRSTQEVSLTMLIGNYAHQ